MAEKRPAAQPSPAPAQPSPALRHPKIAVPGFNSFQKKAILLLRNGVPRRRRSRRRRPFRDAFRIPLWSVSIQGTRILGSKKAPRGDHFGSLFGYHSGAYRFKEREFMSSEQRYNFGRVYKFMRSRPRAPAVDPLLPACSNATPGRAPRALSQLSAAH